MPVAYHKTRSEKLQSANARYLIGIWSNYKGMQKYTQVSQNTLYKIIRIAKNI